jgi:hypothetical protein
MSGYLPHCWQRQPTIRVSLLRTEKMHHNQGTEWVHRNGIPGKRRYPGVLHVIICGELGSS